ncbi:MAG: hypothetical protein EPO68_03045 [Planctomycetota bacterium]|nr:MAG: hypothetical protein EPO68_03045 [Planctomycetota bacterium]
MSAGPLARRAAIVRLLGVALPTGKSIRAWLAFACVLLLASGCRSAAVRAAAVPASAEDALERALDRAFLVQAGAQADGPEIAALLAEVEGAAPDWWALARARQDEQRRAAGALTAYAHALAAWSARPDDARAAYLCARIEGAGGRALFEHAAELDAASFWPWHGLAQLALGRGARAEAQRLERRALARARCDYERLLAYDTLARALDPQRHDRDARDLFEEVAQELGDALPAQRARGEMLRARTQLQATDPGARDLAWRDARDLLLGERLSARDQAELFGAAAQSAVGDAERVNQLRAIHARWPATLRRAVEVQPDARGEATPLEHRRASFARGSPVAPLAAYLDALPARVRATCLDGAAALDAARRYEASRTSAAGGTAAASGDAATGGDAARALSQSLLRLGWHAEALAFAQSLAPSQPLLAAALELRARSALALESDVVTAYSVLDPGPASEAAGPRGPEVSIARVLRLVDGAARAWWPGLDQERAVPDVLGSPRRGFGALGELVHPGPWYDAGDERAGRGSAGTAVDGLARLAASVGRFALLGRMLVVGTDGCWMARVGAQRERGEQFGTRWSGTTVFCDGAAFGIRPARTGAEIAGLAVHEGYWVDLGALRDWALRIDREIERARAQSGRALVLPPRGAHRESRRALGSKSGAGTRADPGAVRAPWLGESRRVRAAWAADQQRAASQTSTLEHLLEAVSRHEEAHLCDRARLWPPWRQPRRALEFLVAAGFTPGGVQRQLELRAELSALCIVDDPRFVLASLLELAEQGDDGRTAHAHAYDELARALVAELESALARPDGRPAAVDPALEPQWQLHRLAPEELRALALSLARRNGL